MRRWAALALLATRLDAAPDDWHEQQKRAVCGRNASLPYAAGTIPPVINTVYYTGRKDSHLNHLTAQDASHWPAPDDAVRWPSHYRFLYYDDEQMETSMEALDPVLTRAGLPGTLRAFRTLQPGAFKADLWRYAILYACGGIYLDGKMRLAQDWDAFLRKEQAQGSYKFEDGGAHLVSCVDRWVTRLDRFQNVSGVWQGLLVSTPRHPDLLRVLKHVVDNVEKRLYFPEEGKLEMLYVTGPGAFSRATQTPGSGWKGRIRLPCHWGNHGNQLKTIWGSGSLLFLQDSKLHEALRGGEAHSYPALYKQHAVYADDAPPPG
jgi:hypothetical protein